MGSTGEFGSTARIRRALASALKAIDGKDTWDEPLLSYRGDASVRGKDLAFTSRCMEGTCGRHGGCSGRMTSPRDMSSAPQEGQQEHQQHVDMSATHFVITLHA